MKRVRKPKRPVAPRKGDIWEHREFGHLAEVIKVTPVSVEFQWVTRMGRKPFRNTPSQCAALDVFAADYERRVRACVARRLMRWTKREDAILVREWTDNERRTLMAKLPGRTWFAIHRRATHTHGLPSNDGERMPFREAAKRAGFADATLHKVLARAGVRVHVGTKSASKSTAVPRYFVDWDETEEAVKAWLKLESYAVTARRLGVPRETMRAWVIKAGIKGGPFETRHAAWYELTAKIAGWFEGGETLKGAAVRTGMCYDTLHRLLRRSLVTNAGEPRQSVLVRPEAVDRVVALWRRKQARAKTEARCGTQAAGEGQTISADTRIVCEPASPCSPVRRTKSPTMGRANR